ncbi:MAG: shikimate dehydrogenase [Anaeroplasmataceae bacterium]|nr:shikimate dehydrogenase [Anaeroplasmataceae bacterium]
MKQYGLLGEHLSHSYSKMIHTFIFEKLGIKANYQLLECSLEELPCYIQALREEKYFGFNVTIPYKKAIMPYLDEIDAKANQIGSVNTVYLKNGKVIGTNTDYDGFLETIRKYQIEVSNKKCYILGTGGASLAVRQVLKDLGGKCIFVSRTPVEHQISYQDLEDKEIDILVNTTPVGMYPNVSASPVSAKIAKKAGVVIDIIFNPKATRLLQDAGSTIHGLYMLIMQALKAEEIWQEKPLNVSIEDLIEEIELLIEPKI